MIAEDKETKEVARGWLYKVANTFAGLREPDELYWHYCKWRQGEFNRLVAEVFEKVGSSGFNAEMRKHGFIYLDDSYFIGYRREIRECLNMDFVSKRYERRSAAVAQPERPSDWFGPAHLLVMDFTGKKPPQLIPAAGHHHHYVDDLCDQSECERYRGDTTQ